MAARTLARAAKSLSKSDVEATEALGEYDDSLPVRALSRVGKLGDQPELRLLSSGVIAVGLLVGDERLSRAGMRMLLAHEIATLAKDFVKVRVNRTRPRTASTLREARPRRGSSKAKELSSFPSGHSAGATAVALAFAREYPGERLPALAGAAAIALAQVPKRAHYPSDVAVGTLIGVAAEALLAALWPSLPPSPQPPHPPAPRRQ